MKAGILALVFALLVLVLVAVPSSLAVQEPGGPAAKPPILSEMLGAAAPESGITAATTWTKTIDGVPWTPGMTITRQTSDTIVVVEVLKLEPPSTFDQVERWDPTRLELLYSLPTTGALTLDPAGALTWTGQVAVPTIVTLTKEFRVLPCTWTTTLLDEELWLDGLLLEERPVEIDKVPPVLTIGAEWGGSAEDGAVYPGQVVSFTLLYSNTGGYENDVMIRNTFPPDAPFIRSDPPPDQTDPDGLWAEWDVGDLAQDAQGEIDVTVLISSTLLPPATLEVWDGIYNHAGELQDWVVIPFHVAPPITWTKTVDGVPWMPGLTITRQTADTLVVVERLQLLPPYTPAAATTAATTVAYTTLAPSIEGPIPELPVAASVRVPATIAKSIVAVLPLADPGAVLWDQLNPGTSLFASQDFESIYDAYDVFAADDFQNSDAWIIERITTEGEGYTQQLEIVPIDLHKANALHWYIFPDNGGEPAGVPGDGTEFWSLSLPPTDPQVDPAGIGVGDILLTLSAPVYLPPGIWWLVFFPSLDFAPDFVQYGWYGAPDPVWGNPGQRNNPGGGFQFEPGWSTNSEGADYSFRLDGLAAPPTTFSQVELWDTSHLRLIGWGATGGSVVVTPGALVWGGEIDKSTTITLTKRFQILPCTWTETTLHEELWLNDVLQEERAVRIQKMAPVLRLDSEGGGVIYAGQPVSLTLSYGNSGGYENDVMIRAEFPPGATFLTASPPPNRVDAGGLWAEWDLGDLAQNAEGQIDVMMQPTPDLRPPATLEVWAGFYDHVDTLRDEVTVSFDAGLLRRRVYLPIVMKRYAP